MTISYGAKSKSSFSQTNIPDIHVVSAWKDWVWFEQVEQIIFCMP
jgi:hypothetical protein